MKLSIPPSYRIHAATTRVERILYPLWCSLLETAKLLHLVVMLLGLAACTGSGRIKPTVTAKTQESSAIVAFEATPSPTIETTPAEKWTPTLSPTSAAAAATFTPTSTLMPSPTIMLCWSQGGHFEHGELESELLPDPLSYRVYLPPCYDDQTDRRYPVLYLVHGQSYNDDQWERLGAGDVADQLIATGELPPFIIVMPRDRIWKEPTEDYFGRAVAEELVVWIDDSYRTISGRHYRAVGGLSRGGAWALHLGLSYWELFGAIGGHSGFIFHTDTYLVKSWLDDIPAEMMPRIYLDVGDKDRPPIMQSAIWFEDLLTQRNIPHEWHIFSGYHEEAYWQAHVEEYLKWYAHAWIDE